MALAEEIIAAHESRWKDCEGLQEATLLRLVILRDIIRELHAERSSRLAKGSREEARSFKAWEERIEVLRNASTLHGELREAIAPEYKLQKRTRLLPDTLFTSIDKEKLTRYDRAWEAAIAAEAASIGWCFWALDAWVSIPLAEKWNQALARQLIPHGIVLFAESAPDSQSSSEPSLWRGRWYVVLKPRYMTPGFQLNEIPGTSMTPEPPKWKILFSPKMR